MAKRALSEKKKRGATRYSVQPRLPSSRLGGRAKARNADRAEPTTARTRQTDLQRLVRAGALKAGAALVGTADNQEVFATVEADGTMRLTTGEIFRKPDDAAEAVVGRRTTGMTFWHVIDVNGIRRTLRSVRDAR